MKMLRVPLLMIGLLLCSQGFAATAQQNKMTTCNADATAKSLKTNDVKGLAVCQRSGAEASKHEPVGASLLAIASPRSSVILSRLHREQARSRNAYFFFRHSLMKVLRASPVRAWVVAVALQVFIFSC